MGIKNINMIIITGVSKGIGKFLFETFSKFEEEVIGVYNTTIPEYNNLQNLYKVDISNYKEVENFYSSIENNISNIKLINAAGTNYSAYAHKSDIDQWKKVIEVNLFGTFHMTKYFLNKMRLENYGRIINFSSVVAQKGIPGTSAYAASKSALWGMSKSVAEENASKGITINTLNLGYFNIGMINEVSTEVQNIIKKQIPVGNEFGDPINIYNAVKFIFDSPYLTGTSININGGLF